MNPNNDKINQFLEDTVMYNLVKSVLESQFDLNKIREINTVSDKGLGEITRACLKGSEWLKDGFKELEKYRIKTQNKKDNVNPAY